MKLMQNATWTEKSETFLRHKNLLSHIKMGKEILTFRNIEIKKKKKKLISGLASYLLKSKFIKSETIKFHF